MCEGSGRKESHSKANCNGLDLGANCVLMAMLGFVFGGYGVVL